MNEISVGCHSAYGNFHGNPCVLVDTAFIQTLQILVFYCHLTCILMSPNVDNNLCISLNLYITYSYNFKCQILLNLKKDNRKITRSLNTGKGLKSGNCFA